MKTVLMRATIFCLYFTIVVCKLDDDWLQFKTDYNKTYKNKIQENKRWQAFKNNLKEINKHNERYKNGLETYKKGVTFFADLTKKQFDKKYKLDRGEPLKKYIYNRHDKRRINNNITVHFDWIKKGAVTRVKEQGICGSCWIFSAIGVLEGYHFRKTGKLISFSEQNVVDCFSNTSCLGGYPGEALTYVQDNGVSTEADYPYKDKQLACRPSSTKIRIEITSRNFINGNEEDMRKALEKYGPISVSMFVDGKLRLYKEGIWYHKVCSEVTNHAMVLVGYGTEEGLDYWLIKNSWGPNWGENGYLRIVRNRHENYCGLTNESIYVV